MYVDTYYIVSFLLVGCPSLICITFNAEILVYSLPALRPVAVVPFTPLNDLRYVTMYAKVLMFIPTYSMYTYCTLEVYIVTVNILLLTIVCFIYTEC